MSPLTMVLVVLGAQVTVLGVLLGAVSFVDLLIRRGQRHLSNREAPDTT